VTTLREPVLVADDDDRVAGLFALALRRAGYEVLRARDGVEALEMIARQPVGLLVLDNRMPRLAGQGVIDALRADPATQRLPIIMVTAEAEVDARVRSLDAGADDYLAKPVDMQELVARVRTHLRSQAVWSNANRREMEERSRVLGGIADLTPVGRPEEIAAQVATQLLGISGCAFAAVLEFVPNGSIVPLAVASALVAGGRAGTAPVGAPLGEQDEFLRTKAAGGPWIEILDDRPRSGFLGELELDAVVLAPLRHAGSLFGLVILGLDPAGRGDGEAARAGMLSAAIDASRLVGAILAQARLPDDVSRRREELAKILAERAFYPVFQPIVALPGGVVVGHEALTRFRDGTRPDLRFAEAARVGLGLDYELATAQLTIEASRELPEGTWLSVNVSPELVIEGRRLQALLAGAPRVIVLELTEHAAIEDYPTFSRALDRFRPTARVAVDDAGAGFASLRHILELGPNLVKLDVSLTRGIETDPVRQALIAGLVHFAAKAGFDLLGEAIETRAEAGSLASLGVGFGQGYLFGRPAPVDQAESLQAPQPRGIPVLPAPRARGRRPRLPVRVA
jgi:EAL domain-containing protein (putative c-di-GMP-specific phosphodiesterase class I)/CheY-like chemotaxis protein